MKLQMLALGLAVAAFSAVAATDGVEAAPAEGKQAERGVAIEDLEARAARRFARADADDDGRITPEEFAAVEPNRRGRRGGDGDRGKRRGDGPRHGPGFGGAFGDAALGDAAFDAADADGDGKLTREELREMRRVARDTMRERMRERMFARIDANGDGALDAGEFPPDMQRLRALDADGDGRLTRAEMREGRKHRGEGRRHGKRAEAEG